MMRVVSVWKPGMRVSQMSFMCAAMSCWHENDLMACLILAVGFPAPAKASPTSAASPCNCAPPRRFRHRRVSRRARCCAHSPHWFRFHSSRMCARSASRSVVARSCAARLVANSRRTGSVFMVTDETSTTSKRLQRISGDLSGLRQGGETLVGRALLPWISPRRPFRLTQP